MIPLWLAADANTFGQYGVSATVRFIQASAAIPALLAGEVDALEISAAPVITADLNGKADLVFIASGLNHAILSLYVKPTIKTAADLKGKVLAGDRPGTPNDYAMNAALKLLGVSPADVSVRPLGSSNIVYEALVSGQIDGGIVGPPQSFQAEEKGFHSIQDTFNIPYQNVGMVASRARLAELAPAMPGFLAAYRRAMQLYNQQPDLSMKVLAKYSQESDQKILQRTYAFYKDKAPFEISLQPTLEGLRGMLDALAATIPAAKMAKPEQFVDTRFLSRLPA